MCDGSSPCLGDAASEYTYLLLFTDSFSQLLRQGVHTLSMMFLVVHRLLTSGVTRAAQLWVLASAA
jgi:hypothetical protein